MSTAQRNAAGRGRKRANNFSDIGNTGRTTGLLWKDTGKRDEHGLEPIEGLFTSPDERSRKSGNNSDGSDDAGSSEDMEVPESSAPDLDDVLSERRAARNKRISIPPPPGRSPIKTHLGVTPRRGSSLGLGTSPRRSLTPTLQSSPRRTPNRLLDFSMGEPRNTIEHSPSRTTGRLAAKPRRSVYSLPMSPERSRRQEAERPDEDLTNGIGHDNIMESIVEDDDDDVPRMDGEDVDITINGTSYGDVPDLDESLGGVLDGGDDSTLTSAMPPPAQPVQRGRKRRSDTSGTSARAASKQPERPTKRRATRLSAALNQSEENGGLPADPSLLEGVNDLSLTAENGMSSMHPNAETTRESHPARGRPKTAAKKTGVVKGRPGRPKRAEQAPASTSATAGERTNAGSSATAQVRQVTRRTTPQQDDGVFHTRSGRFSYKPLDYWRGERAIFQKGDRDNLAEIIRVQDLTPVRRAYHRSGAAALSSRRKKKRKYTVFKEEDDEDDAADHEEPWEREPGVIVGSVRNWDPQTQLTTAEEMDQQIAFAASSIETRGNPDAKFRFSKTLTLAWFGCGMVEIPPGGVKRPKNSRKMQLVFFVHYGKVLVDVAGTQFTISKGGMWQVPRGNLYSISNESEHDAKIFFAQGCEIPSDPDVSRVTNLE